MTPSVNANSLLETYTARVQPMKEMLHLFRQRHCTRLGKIKIQVNDKRFSVSSPYGWALAPRFFISRPTRQTPRNDTQELHNHAGDSVVGEWSAWVKSWWMHFWSTSVSNPIIYAFGIEPKSLFFFGCIMGIYLLNGFIITHWVSSYSSWRAKFLWTISCQRLKVGVYDVCQYLTRRYALFWWDAKSEKAFK